MNMKKILAFVLTLCLLLSLAPQTPIWAVESNDLPFSKINGNKMGLDLVTSQLLDQMVVTPDIDDNEMVKVIIVMEDKGVLEADPHATLDLTAQQTMNALQSQQNVLINKIEKNVMDGVKLDVDYSYTWLLNGVATTVPYGTIKEIEAMDGVKRVLIQQVFTVCKADDVYDPNTITDGAMIGREPVWSTGYTGKGMKIAIIDTGLDTDHPNFAALPASKLTDTSATPESVAAVLENLNAFERMPGLTVEDVYRNTKIAYGFNYVDYNNYVDHDRDSMGPHGTHVAGIAAANKIDSSEVVGVAPDAQLFVMKVFGINGGAYNSDILAALEDALMLGADVINMSLGSPAGFTSGAYTSEGESMDEFYNTVSATGTILSVSAGNSYNSAFGNMWGTNANQTMFPDNGITGQPGTYANTMTVASVENVKVPRYYIDAEGYRMAYNDASASFLLPALTTLTGTYGVVAIPGAGAPEDYEGLDVTGKVALVQRGSLSFMDKHAAAEAAGAVAILVYNNEEGEFGMDMTGTACRTPAAAITMADGAYLVAALEQAPELTLTFPTATAYFPNPTAFEISDFSSVGPSPDLTLTPDIAAPGGYIFSTVDNGGYGLMSGTSMAAPNIAGLTALIMQYVRATLPEGTDYRAVTQNLMMSSAVPLAHKSNGLLYSPRYQGAGMANAFNAVSANAYLFVEGADSVKADLGDDAERTGIYAFSFQVHNFGATYAYYRLNTTVQTEGVTDYGGIYFMSGTPHGLDGTTVETSDNLVLTYDIDLDGDTDSRDAYLIYQAGIKGEGAETDAFRYDVNSDETVATDDIQAYLDALVGKTSDADLEDTVLQVAPGETTEINVEVTLADSDKTFFETYYPNGGYVEGFAILDAVHANGVDLSLPYLAFYGDWAEAPVLDTGDFIDYTNNGDEAVVSNQHINSLFTNFAGNDFGAYPGMNVYVQEDIIKEHISLSPNGDGYMDSVTDIYISLLRNASHLSMRFTNVDTGEVFYNLGGPDVSKTCYYDSYGQVVPFVYSMTVADPLPDFEDLANNTHILFEAEVIGVDPDAQPEIWSIPITIDLEAPELLNVSLNEVDGKKILELSFRDNLSTAAVILADGSGNIAYEISGVDDVEPDENGYQNNTLTFDVTDLGGKLMIILSDYAVNESYYAINLGGEGTPYGDLVAFQYNFTTGGHNWVSFNDDVNKNETTMFASPEVSFVAAEYVNGFVFAQTDTGALYGFKYTDMLNDTLDLETTYIAQLDNVYQDLAYSYKEGKLYGLFSYEYDGYPTTELYSINLNGAYYDEDMWTDVEAYEEMWILNRGGLYGLSMAIDDEGTVYVLGPNYDRETGTNTETAHLWSVGVEYNEWSDKYELGWQMTDMGDIGLSMNYLQSMTWDHNSEKLLWARFQGGATYTISELIEIDPTDMSATKVGTLSGETCAMFAPLTAENAAREEHANVPAMDTSVIGTPILRTVNATMNLGGTLQLTYDIDPWYSDHKSVVWTSSDESVATVTQDGLVTAIGTGSVTITISSAEDDTKFDICEVEVTALDLKLEGIISNQGAGIGNVYGAALYEFNMVDGLATMTEGNRITAPPELNYGLSLVTSEVGRGSLWSCESGNTGMIYEIDLETGVVKDVLQPLNGDMIFGLAYSEQADSFTAIMNMFLYVDMQLNHEEEQKIIDSYDENTHDFTYHKVNMLPYLIESNTGFVTGEDGQGASSEIVMCGVTVMEGDGTEEYMYLDFMGNYGPEISYVADQTLVILDNVGRLWYIDEVFGCTMEETDWGVNYITPDGYVISTEFHGVEAVAMDDGTYSVLVIRDLVETKLTQMFRDGTMPRITYHYSDIEYAGRTSDGAPMFVLSLCDYWNNGTTNELFLMVASVGTGEMTMDENWNYVEIMTEERLYSLGNTGEHKIVASIHSAEVTGGVESENITEEPVNQLGAGIFRAN